MEPNLTMSVPVRAPGGYGRTLPQHVQIKVTDEIVAVLVRGQYPARPVRWEALEEVTERIYTDPFVDDRGESYVTLAWEAHPRYYVGCDYCQREKEKGNTFFPDHRALSVCRSGGRNHCTCPACWG